MKTALKALFEVAKELSKLAESSLPKLREGELIKNECLSNGVYCRETTFNGKTYRATFDFKNRKSHIGLV